MDRIDILIPAAIGLLLLLRPQAFVKPSSEPANDLVKLQRLRRIGAVLLGVAFLYTVVRTFSPR